MRARRSTGFDYNPGVMRIAFCIFPLLAVATADADKLLSSVLESKYFEIRYRPHSRAGAHADRIAAAADDDLERICSQLGVKPQGEFRLFVYDSVGELQTITKTSGVGGFSVPRASHIPFDNDQTRRHEMVHIVAERLPRSGPEARSMFFPDGLANALLEYVNGVHIHAVAAFYKRRNELPSVAEMTGAPDFYGWLRARPGFNGYDVAASWIRHLLDTYGAKNVLRYYTGTEAKRAFGKSVDVLENSWHSMLDAYELRPEVELLLRERAGEKVGFLLEGILGQPSDWQDLGAAVLRPMERNQWSRDENGTHGRSDTQDWSWCELGTQRYGDCAVRATVRAAPGCLGVQLRIGEKAQAMLVQAGTFVWHDKATAHNPNLRLAGGRDIDFLLARRGDIVEIWLDGAHVLIGRAGADPAPVAIGVAGGSATFTNVQVRPLH